MLKKLLHILTGRIFIFSLLILLQLTLVILGTTVLVQYYSYVTVVLQIVSVIIVIRIISKSDNPMYKIAWIVPILLVPVFGAVVYLLFSRRHLSSSFITYLNKVSNTTKIFADQCLDEAQDHIQQKDPDIYRQVHYLRYQAQAPIYQNTFTKLLTPGEEKWACMLQELKKAEKYILMEYFIIEEGVFWKSVYDILVEKARQGISVKLLYDDFGSLMTVDKQFAQQLNQQGIDCRIFNPFKPSLDWFMNYRDHRKICIIDGHVGITGGINLADEYVNQNNLHGHWKDTSLLIKGEAVWSLTMLFFQIWGNCSPETEINYLNYKPTKIYPTDGCVQPFGDSPLDNQLISEMAYMNMINGAKRYVYIQTPYLILDHEMITALRMAAKSGIEVEIITPGKGDRSFVHAVTRANYSILLEAGVKIYEYTPGFIHAKTMVSDDIVALVGTANFDFRSFYLHFECGVYLYRTTSVFALRDDFFKTKQACTEITLEQSEATGLPSRMMRAVLKMFSPLM